MVLSLLLPNLKLYTLNRTTIYFWERSPGNQSSKRLIQLVCTLFAILTSGFYLFVKWDYAGAIAIFSSIMTIVVTLMGIGKKLENQEVQHD